MSYEVQYFYDSYMSYVVQEVLNVLIIPYMVILKCYVIGFMCYVLCVMSYEVQYFYDSYMSYVVQKVLNALIIPYMVILKCYVIC